MSYIDYQSACGMKNPIDVAGCLPVQLLERATNLRNPSMCTMIAEIVSDRDTTATPQYFLWLTDTNISKTRYCRV